MKVWNCEYLLAWKVVWSYKCVSEQEYLAYQNQYDLDLSLFEYFFAFIFIGWGIFFFLSFILFCFRKMADFKK